MGYNDWQALGRGRAAGWWMALCRMIKSGSPVPAPPPTPRATNHPLSPKPHPPSPILPDILDVAGWLTCDRGNVTISMGAGGDGRPPVIQMSAHAATLTLPALP